MVKLINLVGKKFGHLVVLEKGRTQKGHVYWHCKCLLCGSIKEICGSALTTGKSSSCGCTHTKHGQAHSHLHYVWASIKQRCYNKNNHAYHLYGGRGIKVCEEWQDFVSFSKWALSSGYFENGERKCSIERVDVNGNYCPKNCKWIPMKEQWKNTRNKKVIKFKGKEWFTTELCKEYDIPYARFMSRLKRGWSTEEALLTPKLK